MKIVPADLEWQNIDGIEVPISKQFGDVYFSKDNGLLETRHVFLQGNDLTERLSKLSEYQRFTVGETGFGTGLNALALWQLWREVRPNNKSWLHFVSIEKYPLARCDLEKALRVWQELADLSHLLIEQYPLPIAGCHRLNFPEERFSIDLWLGDAADVLPNIFTHKPFDAWFLDGFAPACNPDFWQENILQHIIRLSGEGTTFASFTVAGVVKRGLANYGVQISRPKGFGRKREMLKAKWLGENNSINRKSQNIAVVGAGVAGLNVAWVLAQRGYSVDIYEKAHPLAGASGNPLALLNPKLCDIHETNDHLMVNSWLYSLRFYRKFKAFRPLMIQQIQQKEKDQIANLPLIEQYPKGVLSRKVEFPQHQLTYPQLNLHAAAVEPHVFAEEVLSHPNIHLNIDEVIKIQNDENDLVNIQLSNGTKMYHKVVLCNAKQANDLVTLPFLKSIRGQISIVNKDLLTPNFAYSYGGYLAQYDLQQVILGASFYPNREDIDVLVEDHQHNLDLLKQVSPVLASQLPDVDTWQGRASLRAQTADYFPLLGDVNNQKKIYVLAGLGSKGFLFSPLCAEILVAEMLSEPVPVSETLMKKLKVWRFKKYKTP